MSLFYQKYDNFLGNLYYMSRSSLIAALHECMEDMKNLGITQKLSFVDLDCHAEVQELPQNDIIGIKSFSSYDNDGVYQISAFIVCSTMNDENGIRLSKLIGYMFSRFAGSKSLKVINEDQQPVSCLDILGGTEVMPMSKSDGRMVQYIDITANIRTATR